MSNSPPPKRAGITAEQAEAALDATASKLFGPRGAPAPTAFGEAIVVGMRRATTLAVAMVFGDEPTRRAACQIDTALRSRREVSR